MCSLLKVSKLTEFASCDEALFSKKLNYCVSRRLVYHGRVIDIVLLFSQSSLNRLVEILEEAQPFFVRCIRSNAEKVISYIKGFGHPRERLLVKTAQNNKFDEQEQYTCVVHFDLSLVK